MENKNIYSRKIYKKLLSWKEENSKYRKTALIIKGARQVGKTTLVLQFAEQEYENYVYINFMKDRQYKNCFEGSLDANAIVQQINYQNDGFKFIPNKTLIIFDEIQECARARSSLKYFCEDGNYDVICTGSLLGVMGYNAKKDASIPVGFESHLTMKSMDFQEFMFAQGFKQEKFEVLEEKIIHLLPIEESIHNKMIEHYKTYLLVGGMPEVVTRYIETKNINDARHVQKRILETYRNDFGRHLDENEDVKTSVWDKTKLNRLYESIPKQLAKSQELDSNTSTKFKFGQVSSGARFRDYSEAIQWLKDAGLINVCYNVENIKSPINAYKIENNVKIYMNDTGLFMSTIDFKVMSSIYMSDFGTYKGYIYENVIADQLSKNGFELYYYEKNSRGEIDFIITTNSDLIAIDSKSNKGNTETLSNTLKKNPEIKGIKLSNNNVGISGNLLTIPSYMTYMITENFKFPK